MLSHEAQLANAAQSCHCHLFLSFSVQNPILTLISFHLRVELVHTKLSSLITRTDTWQLQLISPVGIVPEFQY